MNWKRFLRKTHRWLGLLIGIQFLAWTLGGLYFSWSDLDQVHGDDLRNPSPTLPADFEAVSPDVVIRSINALEPIREIRQVVIIPGPLEPLYRIQYSTDDPDGQTVSRTRLAIARDGRLRDTLGEGEARTLALAHYAGAGHLSGSERIETTGSHHEYRGGPVPAWAFTFEDARRTRIYVSVDHGTVTTLRNSKWRIFDFLWMLHTMDYAGRDNFNNTLLRAFSILGLATITSGFLLFAATSTLFTGREKRRPGRS